MGGIKHNDVGDSLSKAEWESSDTHAITADIDMDNHFLLHHKMRHYVHATLESGATQVSITSIPAGFLEQDFHVYKLAAAVDTAPAGGRDVTFCLSNGVGVMSVTISDSAVTATTSVGAFDMDVSNQNLSLCYSQDAGGSSGKVTAFFMYYYIPNI